MSFLRDRDPLDLTEFILCTILAAVLVSFAVLGCQPSPARPDRATQVEIRTVPCPNGDGDCVVIEPRLPRGER